MKNTIFLFIAALVFGASVNAQSTVDSIKSKYQLQPMPEALTIEKTFPIIGTYQLTAADGTAQNVTVSLDQENKGIVWVEGLPQGKFKAYLRKAPGTYRIVAQKNDEGKQIPEGTMSFDPSTNVLNVALGKKYDDADPTAIFNMNGSVDADVVDNGTTVKTKTKSGATKTKSKVVFYSATKADTQNTSSIAPVKQ
jgi:hypothetical protein